MPVGRGWRITSSMKPVLAIAAASAALAAPAAHAAAPSPFPGMPTPAVISQTITPVVNSVLTANHWTGWRFAKAVCVYTSTRGMYLCTAAHVLNGVKQGPLVDVWEVDVKGHRVYYKPASVCPVGPGLCVNSDTTPLTQPQQ